MKKEIVFVILLIISFSSVWSIDICADLYPTNVTKYNECKDFFDSLNKTEVINITHNITNNITNIQNITKVIVINSSVDLDNYYTKSEIDNKLDDLKDDLKDLISTLKSNSNSELNEIYKLLLYRALGIGNFSSQPKEQKSTIDELKEFITLYQLISSLNQPKSQVSSTNYSKLIDDLRNQINSLQSSINTLRSERYEPRSRANYTSYFVFGLFAIAVLGYLFYTNYLKKQKTEVVDLSELRKEWEKYEASKSKPDSEEEAIL